MAEEKKTRARKGKKVVLMFNGDKLEHVLATGWKNSTLQIIQRGGDTPWVFTKDNRPEGGVSQTRDVAAALSDVEKGLLNGTLAAID